MSYYLDDIRDIVNQSNPDYGYNGFDIDSIYVDRLIEPSTLTSVQNFILLQAQGGLAQQYIIDNRDFAVFVYRSTSATAQDDSNHIWAYLNHFSGGSNIRRIVTRQTPMPFNSSQVDGVRIYMFTMTAQLNNGDISQYK